MLRLTGASPFVGIAAGVVLLAVGLLMGGSALAVAGGFVLAASIVRMFADHGRPQPGSRDRGSGRSR